MNILSASPVFPFSFKIIPCKLFQQQNLKKNASRKNLGEKNMKMISIPGNLQGEPKSVDHKPSQRRQHGPNQNKLFQVAIQPGNSQGFINVMIVKIQSVIVIIHSHLDGINIASGIRLGFRHIKTFACC